MARRATYIIDIHKTEAQRLLISGGWEFMPPEGPAPKKDFTESIAKAFNIIGYDAGLLSRQEAELLKDFQIDKNRYAAQQEPLTILTTANGDTIGILRFPSLPKGQDIPSEKTIKKISTVIKKEQSKVKLLIALSDWGWVGEREYLAQNPEFVPDLLMGSGRGSGVNGRFESDDRCVWIRPYDKGRTLCEIDVYDWPQRISSFTWDRSNSIKTLSIGLGDQYSDNPDVEALLH